VTVGLTGSGVVPRVLESFVLSLRTGGGACNTCAAVGPPCPLPFSIATWIPGLRDGGVVAPANTGNSSALGTLCLTVKGFLSTRAPFTAELFLDPWEYRARPGSAECGRLESSIPFCRRGEPWTSKRFKNSKGERMD
jgi:hypothetical protein